MHPWPGVLVVFLPGSYHFSHCNVHDFQYIDKVIAQVDADGNGDVSFEEFCEMMTNGIPV